ncbi:uncharacterized protein TM35_000181470 [Trypanosoma theileri]|uniref:Uncharacterized protein n=1 Tax=Trypanosoma theileri TaxID=67003 RepID=A0A1X0NVE4_9TRYP|nr:uncharacterized protein TM35_000181470 [Trypanosoma theileri]ORC88090.1 hypothetical protein TM35_000181470 [Trypanosoma theileri]
MLGRRQQNQQQQQRYDSANLLEAGVPLLTRFMPYLPMIIKVATGVPAFFVGFILACLFFLVVGREALRYEYAPVAGFHLLALLLLRSLFTPWREGKERAAEVRRRVAAQRSFVRDVQLQWRETLD